MRHIEVGTLWLQRLVEPGKDNVADLGTKHVDATTLSRIIDKLGYVKVDGRSSLILSASVSLLVPATQRATVL